MTPEDAGLQPLHEIGDLWTLACAGERVAEARPRAALLRDRLRASGRIAALRTCPLADFPWPGDYGFWQAGIQRPIVLRHRMSVVQFRQHGKIRTLLMNPTDTERSRQTPYFRRLEANRLGVIIQALVLTPQRPVLEHLAELGIAPETVDYVTYDHLHTQDLRGAVGTPEIEPRFPNALFLIPRAEAEIFRNIHPLQRDWFIPQALDGVRRKRVVLLEGDYQLGDGVALVRTPGHTAGNHTLVLNTSRGLYAISENGVAPECYVPERSNLAALRRHQKDLGREVVLNGNTLEGTLDQYAAMVLEKQLVDWTEGFPNILSSSPFVPSWLTPGMQPTYVLEPPDEGKLETNGVRELAA